MKKNKKNSKEDSKKTAQSEDVFDKDEFAKRLPPGLAAQVSKTVIDSNDTGCVGWDPDDD